MWTLSPVDPIWGSDDHPSLDDEERIARDRLATRDLRAVFVATRALCRAVLSHYVPHVKPHEWRFDRTEHGRPYVVAPRSIAFDFNLAHTSTLVACAVSPRRVGIDVEPLSSARQILELAPRIFSVEDCEHLATLAGEMRARRAVELWTMREASTKAIGGSLADPIEDPPALFLETRLIGDHVVAIAAEGESSVAVLDSKAIV